MFFETGCKPILLFYLEIWGTENQYSTLVLKQVLDLSCFDIKSVNFEVNQVQNIFDKNELWVLGLMLTTPHDD